MRQESMKQHQHQTGKLYPWMVVAMLWVVALLNYMDRQMLSTMRPSMQLNIRELESATNFGYLMGIFLWIYGFMSPVAGIIADRVNRKWLIVGSLFVWSAITLSMGFATSFRELYWLRAGMGVSEALYLPAALSLIADYHSSRTRSLAIGIHMTGLYIGQALGGFGATIAAAFSWEQSFRWFGLTGLLYAVILIIFLRDKNAEHSKKQAEPGQKQAEPGQKQTEPGQKQADSLHNQADAANKKSKPAVPLYRGILLLLSNTSFWIILFYFAIPSLPGWGIKNWLPTLFADNQGMDMAAAGPIATITIAASSLLGVITGGILSDKWVQRNIRGRIFTSAIGLGLTIPALLLLGFGTSLFHIVAAAFCFGFGFGMFDANNMPILCQFVGPKHRGTAYGLMNMTGVFAGAFVTDLLGRSTDAGNLGRSFAMFSAIVLVAIILQLIFLRPEYNDYPEAEESDWQL